MIIRRNHMELTKIPGAQFVELSADFPEGEGRNLVGSPDEPKTDWDWLSRGKTVGKSSVVRFEQSVSTLPINMFELRGEDKYAMPLSIQLMPIGLLPSSVVPIGQEQNASGFITTSEALRQAASYHLGNPKVRVSWGIGGVQAQVVADLLCGLNINISASFVRAEAFVENVSGGSHTNDIYNIGAFIGPGTPTSRAQNTVNAGFLMTNELSPILTVPNFAKHVTLCGANISGSVYVGTITFFRNTGCTVPTGTYLFAGNSANSMGLPIPNGSFYFRVTGGIDSAWNNAIFDLAL